MISLFGKGLTLYVTIMSFKTLAETACENNISIGEIASYQCVLFYPQLTFMWWFVNDFKFDNSIFFFLTLYLRIPTFNNPEKEAF